MKHLIEDRGEPRSSAIYEALVVANWDTRGLQRNYGRSRRICRKLSAWKNTNFFHSVLQVYCAPREGRTRKIRVADFIIPGVGDSSELLAPKHYAPRDERQVDRAQPEGRAHVALGLLRDQQHELAYDKLKEMIRDRIPFPPWVYDIFICAFTQLGFVDEAFSILQSQRELADDKHTVSLNVLYFLLDECSRARHQVKDEICVDRDGGHQNPESSGRHHPQRLEHFLPPRRYRVGHSGYPTPLSRGVKLGSYHFEALIDCYAVAEDLENALRVLCIMSSCRSTSDISTTRSIYSLLRHSPGRADAAIDALFDLRRNHEIPISAFNVVIEALCARGDTEKAVALYQQVRQLCRSGPNAATFRLLLSGHPRSEAAGFLLAEMEVFSIKLDLAMHDDVVCSYALDENSSLEAAFGALRDLENEILHTGDTGVWLSKHTILALAERCFKEEDPRIWHVVDGARLRGMHMEDDIHKLSAKWDPAMSASSPLAVDQAVQTTAG